VDSLRATGLNGRKILQVIETHCPVHCPGCLECQHGEAVGVSNPKPRSIWHFTCPVCKRVIAARGGILKFCLHMPYDPGRALFTEKGRPCKTSGKTLREAEVLAAEIEQRRKYQP
jgi:hypothetical protein